MRLFKYAAVIRLAVFLICCAALPGCLTSPGPVLRIVMTGLPSATTNVAVAVAFVVQDRATSFTAGERADDRISVSFPAGARGAITVKITALDAHSCALGEGTMTLVLTSDNPYDILFPLMAINQSACVDLAAPAEPHDLAIPSDLPHSDGAMSLPDMPAKGDLAMLKDSSGAMMY